MGDEFLERQRRGLEICRCAGFRQRQVELVARPQEVDHDQADEQRDEGSADEPKQRFAANAPDRGGVAHMSDADDQRREDERRDDHLDQPQEQIGDEADITGDCLVGLRIGPGDAAEIPDEDAGKSCR